MLIAVAFLGGMASSWRLWFGFKREFPRVSVFENLTSSLALEIALSSVLVGTLVCLTLIGYKLVSLKNEACAGSGRGDLLKRWAILCALIVLCFLAAGDYMRWQPWVYQYGLMLLAIWCGMRRGGEEIDLTACRLIVAAIYFWGGVQKLNASFAETILPWLLFPVVRRAPQAVMVYVPLKSFGWLIAVGEMLIGIGLFSRRCRRFAISAAILLHFSILVLFVLSRRNSVVWIWNVAMVGFVIALFHGWKGCVRDVARKLKPSLAVTMVFGVCWLLPGLSFWGWWQSYFSAALYSGNTLQVQYVLDESLPFGAQAEQAKIKRNGELFLLPNAWSSRDLNVPVVPERRAYRSLGRIICGTASDRSKVRMRIYERPRWSSVAREVSLYACDEL